MWQLQNAELPIDVALDGIVMDLKFVQLSKDESPIDVTLDGIVINVK